MCKIWQSISTIHHVKLTNSHLAKINQWQFVINPTTLKIYVEGKIIHLIRKVNGVLVMGSRFCVPDMRELKKEIMEEAYCSAYTMHLGSTKMYRTLRDHYWWQGMMREVAEFISWCLICYHSKVEHQRPTGCSQPLPILELKWENITMDLVVGLPRTQSGQDSIWVVVDRLTKSAHFLPFKTTYSMDKLENICGWDSSTSRCTYVDCLR